MAGKKKKTRFPAIDTFNFHPGRKVAGKYEIVSLLGSGWEGEVYKVKELSTGIERAAKFFFPHRNPNGKLSTWYARKLHKLRHCSIIIKYQTQENMSFDGMPVVFLVSEYVDGVILKEFLSKQPGKRLSVFQGLHLLYALACGIETVHHLREYHGDLHSENVIVHRCGLGFDLKLLDMYQWSHPRLVNIQDDVRDLIRIFYDAIGGAKMYRKHPPQVKAICCGLRRDLILKKFKTAGHLREYLETMRWT